MKRPILIIASGVVVISLLLLINEKWIKEPSAPKSADKQQESAAEGQGSSTAQRTMDKPTSKPPVYDLTSKAHWYNPETTVGLYESKTLVEWLEPFKPNAEEFQIIAQYENEYKKLRESLPEDEYYSVEGRKRLIDGILELNKKLREQLGEERTQFYAEVRELDTGYYHTWKALTVNDISEERVVEFRKLADEFNQQMHGWPLYRADRKIARSFAKKPPPNINFDDQERIAKSFRDRIENEFGKQVLDDILFLSGDMFFMDQLDKGDPTWLAKLMQDPKHQDRLNNLYDVDLDLFNDNEEEVQAVLAETERQKKREMELAKEWAKHYETPLLGPEEILFISH